MNHMDEQQIKELKEKRIRIFLDSCGFKKPERIGIVSMFQAWQILDAGYKLSEAMTNYELLEKITREHVEKYNWDLMVNDGTRNPFLLYQALGSTAYQFDDNADTINHIDNCCCTVDEIDELTADFDKFMWEKGMTHKYAAWDPNCVDVEYVQKALDMQNLHAAYRAKMQAAFRSDYGIPAFVAPRFAPSPVVEEIFSNILGIKGMSIAMRRYEDKFDALVAMLNARNYTPFMEAFKALPAGPDLSACFDGGTTYLCQNALSLKQWDKYYWPYAKEAIDACVEKDFTFSILPEGEVLRFADCFRDVPKGILSFMLETDDVFEFRKQLPNCAIMGGMDNLLLNNGTKEECVDFAKKLIDELGRDGGYYMTQTKIGTYHADGKGENVKAVNDFVLNYKI